jgi:putative ABC transport system permease protein
MNFPWHESWNWFRRDLRNGELTLLLLALILAVAATTSLRFFSSGVEKRLQQEAARLLAADLVLRSTRPVPENFIAEAETAGLDRVHTLEFSSVLVRGEEFQLAAVKAVSEGYPLRGEMRLREGSAEVLVQRHPAPGEIWLDARLVALLRVAVGDSVQLGDTVLRVGAVLAYEPGQGGFSAFSPRALVNLADVPASGVVQPGSRLRYQLMLRGNERALSAYKEKISPQLGVGMRLLDVREGRPEIGTPLARSQSYFSLAGIAAVVLAGLAIATSARRFAQRHYDLQALLRCLGASRRDALARLLGEVFWLWLIAIVAGALLGILAAQGLGHLLAGLLPGGEPLFTLGRPLLTGVLTATLALLGFALPALLALGSITPLRVLRRDLPARDWSRRAATGGALAALLALLALETGQPRLALIVGIGGGLGALLLWRALATSLAWLRRRLLRAAPLGLLRNPEESSTQILGLALGLTVLLLVASLRGELLAAWQGKIPAGAPNQFALNIAEDERVAVADFLHRHGVAAMTEPYAVVRGRLTAINDAPVQSAVSKEGDNGRDESLNRELNLTWRAALPEGNRLVTGRWWPEAGVTGTPVSVEKKLAERLQLKIGDRLRFTLAEGELEATVASLREVDWDSFRPNFYFVFPPRALDEFPASYLTSFYLPPEKRGVLAALVQSFPTLILIDVAATMSEVQRLLDQVARAVEAVLLFVLAGALLVIAAQVLASLEARRYEAALLRVAGIGRYALQRRLAQEFAGTGALAGLVAALLNELLAAAVHMQVLDLAPVLHPALWWQAPLAGAVLALASGLPGARRAWQASPLLVLRRG